MIYLSWAWSEVNGGVEDVALVYWKKGGKDKRPPLGTKATKDNANLVEEVTELSAGDKDFVKMLYPWSSSVLRRKRYGV